MIDYELIAYNKRKEEMIKTIRRRFTNTSWLADDQHVEQIAEFILEKLNRGYNSGMSLGQ